MVSKAKRTQTINKMATDCLEKIPIRLKEPIEKINYSRETGAEYKTYITEISIPCGKCARCIQRRKMEWTFRMLTEMETAKTAYFVTLTYAPEWVPYNKYGRKVLVETREKDLKLRLEEQGRKRITKTWKKKQPDRSIQGYLKRLRINIERRNKKGILEIENLRNNLKEEDKVKYYAAGEYGSERSRPHYHLIIYNATAREIREAWPYGGVDIGEANDASISYLMKYLDKRLGEEQDKLKPKEFNCMSEGIGKGYINRMKDWHKRNLDVLYVRMKNGILVPMPRYLRKEIFTEEEMKAQVILVEDILKEIKEEKICEYGSHNRYNEIITEQRKEDERRFKKKIKKRIVD